MPMNIRFYIVVESGEAHVDDSSEYTLHKQRRPTFYKISEPPTPEPFTPAGINILDKRQKLRRPTLYSTPKPPTPEPFTPLEDKIAIFQQTPMKEAISPPELSFIKRKTRRTKAAIMTTAASTRHKRLRAY